MHIFFVYADVYNERSPALVVEFVRSGNARGLRIKDFKPIRLAS